MVGPRFAKLVPTALYDTAEGRSWKYLGLVNACAASFEPTTLPLTVIRLPLAWLLNATCAKPVISERVAEPEDGGEDDDRERRS